MTSSRLPGKILMEAAGKPMLEHMVERLRRVSLLEDIIIATTTNAQDEANAHYWPPMPEEKLAAVKNILANHI